MATSRSMARAPACLSCLRRVTLQQQPATMTMTMAMGMTQSRGKATKAELEDLQGIPVRLLEDIVGFGRKDAIMRVKPGRMRNYWFPRNRAEYMTKQRFKEMGITEAAIGVRDRSFGMQNANANADNSVDQRFKNAADIAEEELLAEQNRKRKEALTLPAEQTHELLAVLLPPVLQFERKPIAVPTAEPAAPPARRFSPLLAANAEVSDEDRIATAEKAVPVPEVISIFGSVSKEDILARVAEMLAADAEGSRASLTVENITILGLEEGEDRIKRIGVFDVQILAGKGLEPVVKRVEVVPEALPEI